jgi:hypothetical protein
MLISSLIIIFMAGSVFGWIIGFNDYLEIVKMF